VTADTSGDIRIDGFETVNVFHEIMSGSGDITIQGRGDDGTGNGVYHAGSDDPDATTNGNVTTTGTITVIANVASIDMVGDDMPDNNSTGSTTYTGGQVDLMAANDVRLGTIISSGSVSVYAGFGGEGFVKVAGGSIIDDNGAEPVNITAATTVALSADGTIGAWDPLDDEFGLPGMGGFDPIEVTSGGITSVWAGAIDPATGGLLINANDSNPFKRMSGRAPIWINGTVPGNELPPLNGMRTDGLVMLNWSELPLDGPSEFARVVAGIPFDLYRAATGGNIRLTIESLSVHPAPWILHNVGMAFPTCNGYEDLWFDIVQPMPCPELWSIEGRGIRLPDGVARTEGWSETVALAGLHHDGKRKFGLRFF
jgi:hypothetical protein